MFFPSSPPIVPSDKPTNAILFFLSLYIHIYMCVCIYIYMIIYVLCVHLTYRSNFHIWGKTWSLAFFSLVYMMFSISNHLPSKNNFIFLYGLIKLHIYMIYICHIFLTHSWVVGHLG
jgi:hypothetical protein